MRGARLSPVRVASVPRRLYHLDSVTIGSTTFVVHIHEDRRPCVECTSGSGSVHQVPLFSVSKQGRDTTTNATLKRTRDATAIDNMTQASRDPKKALTMLKRSLLTRHDSAESAEGSSIYVDRSARRRTMHPGSHLDTPGVPNPRSASDLPLYHTTHTKPLLLAQIRSPLHALHHPQNLLNPLHHYQTPISAIGC